jgi:hypothetical protein
MAGDSYYLFDERFSEAFLHRPHKVLGSHLPAFTYWHRLQLEWVNSRLLLGGATLWDVWLAVQICRSSYPKQAQLPPPHPSYLWKLWWHLRFGWRDPKKEVARFLDYYHDYVSVPKFWGGSGSSKLRLSEAYEKLFGVTRDANHDTLSKQWADIAKSAEASRSSLDESLEAVAEYCRLTHRPPSEAWNLPIGELHWMVAAIHIGNGAKLDIWGPFDDMRFEAHKKKRQENILRMAADLQSQDPELSPDLALAQAEVAYWEKVVKNVDAYGK